MFSDFYKFNIFILKALKLKLSLEGAFPWSFPLLVLVIIIIFACLIYESDHLVEINRSQSRRDLTASCRCWWCWKSSTRIWTGLVSLFFYLIFGVKSSSSFFNYFYCLIYLLQSLFFHHYVLHIWPLISL